MPWSLEIHHIDLGTSGDSTVVVARENNIIRKTVLIDGGKARSADIVHTYLTNTIGVNQVNVIIVTHFDEDHFAGIISLLNRRGTNIYDNAIIYDPGRPPNRREYFSRKRDRDGNSIPAVDYSKYIDAIAAKPHITRTTQNVNSFDLVDYDANNLATIPYPPGLYPNFLQPHWLINKELMWGNGSDGIAPHPAFASVVPAGAPTITCIAANKYVLQHDNTLRYVSDLNIFNGPRMSDADIAKYENGYPRPNDNPKSLGLLIEFNNFRYYVAGDLEQVQEDGYINRNAIGTPFQSGVKDRVNNANNMAGRILAMKTSHHGANTASSRIFINQLRPSAAILSVSKPNRQYSHPSQRAVNILDGYPEQPVLGDINNDLEHPPQPPPPPQRPVRYYLTGYQNPDDNPPTGFGGDASITAGNPALNVPGHIKLTVSEQQSLRPREGQIFRGVKAATQHTAQAVGINLTPAAIDDIADKGAVYGAAVAVAVAVGAPIAAATQALEATAWVGLAGGLGVIEAAFNRLNGGGDAKAVSDAATRVDRGNRVNQVGRGAAAAIGAAMTRDSATAIDDNFIAISNAATRAGATAAAGYAAAVAASIVLNTPNMGADDAGYTVAAAFGAVAGGATVAQGAAIAAAIAATVAVVDGETTARVTTRAAMAANMPAGQAALAGSVASASYWEGALNYVYNGVKYALMEANFAGLLAVYTANAALKAATIPAADLFNIRFRYRGNNGVTENENFLHI
ncbi:hypothetical protein B4U84_13155 [Westiellopsis prolifica IICB1]|nr:hypothetical protein B4U84_13155 [Westiellopsis prolifica IICB1]